MRLIFEKRTRTILDRVLRNLIGAYYYYLARVFSILAKIIKIMKRGRPLLRVIEWIR
jgi:hypothetical protein